MDLIELNQYPSVAANARSTLVTDELMGKSVHALIFERGGTAFTDAHLANLRVRLDGKDVVNGITGAQLVDLNEYDGVSTVTNYTFLFFGDPTARTMRGEHIGDLDFSIYNKPLEIEVDIGGATAPTLKTYALTGVPKLNMGLNFDVVEAAHFRHLRRSVIQPSAAVSRNTYGISLGSKAGGRLRRVAFFHSNLTSVEFKKASFTKWDDIPIALNSAIQQQFARVPQSGLYVLDRVMDGNQGEADTTVDPDGKPWFMEMALSTSAGDTITAFADLHAAWDMI